ncbi:MAG: UDP-N-acetylmuramoyl-L-alanyl-D-glutamate--2,6-diaminopimelate ligase [Clostridia bacterium]|nr:UDP-N-acetylmuramoyl-L-alanyl-D-glutamate--2,6-diaminopimelate ligase [Clostridiales bacterium]MBQ3505824.1 UDP-N-acetylmuramoyl-L-alanyl-D-glutamate--2,6-diaminopimelate ligase [Clostridia bacterium]
MRLSKLVRAVRGCEMVYGSPWERDIEQLSTDSRTVRQGALFFCLVGKNADGHSYAADAVKYGAVAVVVERKLDIAVPQLLVKDTRLALALIASVFYGEPSERLKVVGITGTNGKTTTAHMLASIFEASGKKTGLIGTLGVRYADKYFPADLTTPDPIPLQKTLSEMVAAGVQYVVMEVSAHALYYKKTAGVRFAACIFTNATQDHLDFFGDMQTYKEAKGELFLSSVCPIAVLNGDDPFGRELGKRREREQETKSEWGVKTCYYALQTPADAFAIITDESMDGTECVLNIDDGLCRVSLALAGRHNVYNALAAAVCAVEMQIDAERIAAGLMRLKRVNGRLERAGEYRGARIFVDFAHTPDGLKQSLQTLRVHCKGRLICLFGCGGNRDKEKRPLMGEVAAKYCDFAILTSDNPRYEDPLDILSEIERGYRRFSMRYVVVPERKKAMEYAIESLRTGDILLVAGKGGEDYQEIMGIKYPFNDHDIITEIVEEQRVLTKR